MCYGLTTPERNFLAVHTVDMFGINGGGVQGEGDDDNCTTLQVSSRRVRQCILSTITVSRKVLSNIKCGKKASKQENIINSWL